MSKALKFPEELMSMRSRSGLHRNLFGPDFPEEVVVVCLDMSVPELAIDEKGETEVTKNLRAVREKVLPNLRPGCDLRIWGITGDYIESPRCILRSLIDNDPGYIGELLEKELQSFFEEWEKASPCLKPTEKFKDIFGFLRLVAMILKRFPIAKKSLVILSNMRNCTPTIDLEKPERLDPKLLETLKDKIQIPTLEGTDIYIHGVNSHKKSALYCQELESFWANFISLTKGTLKAYSNLREISLGQERRQP